MAQCDTCGNDYDKSFIVTMNNRDFYFDCFECAIQALAPTCDNCGCRIIGHGVESNNYIFCCAHCARNQSVESLQDRAEPGRHSTAPTTTTGRTSAPF
ncbi:MAG: hypothetical protein OHK0029_36600 [Armatimonadaceae bacterium]